MSTISIAAGKALYFFYFAIKTFSKSIGNMTKGVEYFL